MRAYDSLIGHVKELSEAATRLGGPAGETLLEECTAQACSCLAVPASYFAYPHGLATTQEWCLL